jgi:hypothetical protein
MRTVQIAVGHDLYSYSVDGETAYGPDERLIDKDDNLIGIAPWREQGYTVDRFLKSAHDFEVLVDGLKIRAWVVCLASVPEGLIGAVAVMSSVSPFIRPVGTKKEAP